MASKAAIFSSWRAKNYAREILHLVHERLDGLRDEITELGGSNNENRLF
jgi:hypothetical protein